MQYDNRYISAMQALQKKVQMLEEDNMILNNYLDQAQEQIGQLNEQLLTKESLFSDLEIKLKENINEMEQELQLKDEQIGQLQNELHASLKDQSNIMAMQLSDRNYIQEQEKQIDKLKGVIRKLKEPREDFRQTQSEKKQPYQSRLNEAVDNYFSSSRKSTDDYQGLIRRIQKLEQEIEYLDRGEQLDEKIKVLHELQAEEESFLKRL